MALPDRMKFGIFMGPFHRAGENPTLALERDLELVQWLDYLGLTKPGLASTTAPAGKSSPRGNLHRRRRRPHQAHQAGTASSACPITIPSWSPYG